MRPDSKSRSGTLDIAFALGSILVVYGCGRGTPSYQADQLGTIHQPDTAAKVASSTDPGANCSWDTIGFSHVVDSMMSLAHHGRYHFKVSEQRYEPRRTTEFNRQLPDEVLKAMAMDVHELRFLDSDRNRNAHITLALASFASDSSARSCFEHLSILASDEEDAIPGLTYTNDDVRLKGDRVAWINSTCRLSSQNHSKLAEVLFERLGFTGADRRIECNCGQVICAVKE